MKGFINVVEVILVALITFSMVSQLVRMPEIGGDWGKVKLKLMANDVLFSLKELGVDFFNKTEVENALKSYLSGSENVVYEVRIKGALRSNVSVGCPCSDEEFEELKRMVGYDEETSGYFLKRMKVNGRMINLNFWKANEDEWFSLKFDVFLLPRYVNLEEHENYFMNFLKRGKGVVEVFDFNPSFMNDEIQRRYFGIDKGDVSPGSDGVTFEEREKRKSSFGYTIYKYFKDLPAFYDDFYNESFGESNRFDELWLASGSVSIDKNFGDASLKLTGCEGGSKNMVISKRFSSFEKGEIEVLTYLEENSNITSIFMYDPTRDSGFGAFLSTSKEENTSFVRLQGGSLFFIGHNSSVGNKKGWYDVHVFISNDNFTMYVNGSLAAYYQPGQNEISPGRVGLSSPCNDKKRIYADYIRVTFLGSNEFANMLKFYENVSQAEGDENKVVLVQRRSNVPAATMNVVGSGRLAWLSKNESRVENSDEYSMMLLSLILWASGDEEVVIPNDKIKMPVSARTSESIFKDFNEDIEVILSMEYVI